MSFDLFAFSSSISNSATLQQVSALSDQFLPPQNNNLVVKEKMHIGAMFAFGTSLTRVQFQSPSLRKLINPEMRPFNNAVPSSGQAWGIADLTRSPIYLDPTEQLSAFATQSSAGAERERVFVLLYDEAAKEHVGNKIVSLRVTGTTTVTAEAWTACSLSFDQNLPAGKYAVVGGRMEGASMLAWRVIFPGDPHRPGGPAFQGANGIDPRFMRYGQGGIWGTFLQNDVLQAEVICTAADTAQTGLLDLVKLD